MKRKLFLLTSLVVITLLLSISIRAEEPQGAHEDSAPADTSAREADDGNEVTYPVGLSVGETVKLGKLPVNFAIQGQWMPWHPDNFGQRWNI
jgi:hypothetical protein